MAKTIDELKAKFNEARYALINAEEEERNKVQRPILRELVGKCFVYKNSYSSSESWPLYSRIVSFDDADMTFRTVEFQHKSDDCIEIRNDVVYNFRGNTRFGTDSGWKPLPHKDYERERKAMLVKVQKLLQSAVR